MKNFFNKKFSTKTKLISSAISLMLIVCFAITGTVAWLIDTSGPVEDVFTYGKVDIMLIDKDLTTEDKVVEWSASEAHSGNRADLYTAPNFKLIPGATIQFNPAVRVVKGSEDCYVFVKVEHTNIKNFFAGVNTSTWTQLTDNNGANVAGVYYATVAYTTGDQDLNILSNGTIMVPSDLTNQVDASTTTIKITAYAIQQKYLTADNTHTAYDAWLLVKDAA